jgi:hypothetical protein
VTTPSSVGGPDVGARDGSTKTKTFDTESQRVRNGVDTHGIAAERSAPPNVPAFGSPAGRADVNGRAGLDRPRLAIDGGGT